MSGRIVLIVVCLLVANLAFAGLPTPEQLQKEFIQIILKIDNDTHNFYWKRIETFDNDGAMIHYQIMTKDGEILDKYNFLPKADILNFDEALDKWKRLRNE